MKYILYVLSGSLLFSAIMNIVHGMEWRVWSVGSTIILGMALLSSQIEKLEKALKEKKRRLIKTSLLSQKY